MRIHEYSLVIPNFANAKFARRAGKIDVVDNSGNFVGVIPGFPLIILCKCNRR